MDLGREIFQAGLALPLQRFTPGPFDFLNEEIHIEPTSTAEFYTDFNISQVGLKEKIVFNFIFD
jgi:hypothetical protein